MTEKHRSVGPSARRRARVATIGFSIFVALQVALLARSVMRDDRGLIIVATVGLTVAAVVVSLFVWMRPQWVRLNRLRAMFP